MRAEKDGVVQTLADAGGNREQFIEILDEHRIEREDEGDYEEAITLIPTLRVTIRSHSPYLSLPSPHGILRPWAPQELPSNPC